MQNTQDAKFPSTVFSEEKININSYMKKFMHTDLPI